MHTFISSGKSKRSEQLKVFILSWVNDEFSCSLIFHSELMMPLNCNLVISRPRVCVPSRFFLILVVSCWLSRNPFFYYIFSCHTFLDYFIFQSELAEMNRVSIIRHDRMFLYGSTLFTINLTSSVEMETTRRISVFSPHLISFGIE